jgi:outer membrane murein-binding lipoprotein Lpp
MRVEMLNRYKSQSPVKVKGLRAVILSVLALLVLLVSVPLAKADTGDDLARGLANQRFYVSDAVKANTNFMGKNSNIESELRNAVSKLGGNKDTRIAVFTNGIIPPQYGTGLPGAESYGTFLYNSILTNPKPTVLIMGNAEANGISIISNKLTTAEKQEIIREAANVAISKNYTAAVIYAGEQAANKVTSNATGSLLTTIGTVVVVLLVIAGGVAYLLVSTKKKWTQKVKGLEQRADQVSDQVLKVSDEINFLPEASPSRDRTNAEFGAATQNFSEANTRLRELQKVSPVTLLLKGPDYRRKLDLTGAQFEQASQGLSRVEQQVRSLPGY